jgi:DDB1- and CUL4-associated factor 11
MLTPCLTQVWDMRTPDKPEGLLMGHQAGITCIAAKGDGIRFVSNSKDQSCKLWDLRVMSDANADLIRKAAVLPTWDYRWAMCFGLC